MAWRITFYGDKVEKEILGFPAGILADFFAYIGDDRRAWTKSL